MIEELKKMIFDKLNQQTEEIQEEKNIDENSIQKLSRHINNLEKENMGLRLKLQTTEENLKIALDEIAQNQIRINALLKQLQDKKGGRQYIV